MISRSCLSYFPIPPRSLFVLKWLYWVSCWITNASKLIISSSKFPLFFLTLISSFFKIISRYLCVCNVYMNVLVRSRFCILCVHGSISMGIYSCVYFFFWSVHLRAEFFLIGLICICLSLKIFFLFVCSIWNSFFFFSARKRKILWKLMTSMWESWIIILLFDLMKYKNNFNDDFSFGSTCCYC